MDIASEKGKRFLGLFPSFPSFNDDQLNTKDNHRTPCARSKCITMQMHTRPCNGRQREVPQVATLSASGTEINHQVVGSVPTP